MTTHILSIPLQRIRGNLRQLGHRGLKVAAFCLVISLILWMARPDQRLDVQLVYSFGSGLVSWLLIDLGRYCIDHESPYNWPRGWRGIVLIVVGCSVGHVLGTFIGDAYCGASTWTLFKDRPRLLLNFFLLSLISGAGISFFFYANGKSHFLKSALELSQRQAAESQLKLLESQLEPHMLFNTLANLRVLISTDPERATSMLDHMVAYLRATLGGSRAVMHPLQLEFDRLRDYLELMTIRMGPRLSYSLDLPPELANHPVPPLLLQPLVENAIKHGLEPKVEGGRIKIAARRDGDQVVLEVSDTGVGGAPTSEVTEQKGFGLSQVAERLKTTYGASSTITFVADEAYNTSARVVFPYQNPLQASVT